MDITSIPSHLNYGKGSNPLPIQVEFDRRSNFYSMATNHFHSEYEIYYLFSGERNYFIKDRPYHILPGDLVLIGTNEVHKTSYVDGFANHERVVVYYEPEYFSASSEEYRELLLSVFSQGYPLLRLNLQERLQVEGLLLSMLKELVEQPPGYGLHVRHMAGELLLFAARAVQRRDAIPAEEPTPMEQKMTDIVRFINAHYQEPLDLDGLSARFYISKSHLSRVFKETTGFGFTEYVNITRIREAQRLLRETELSITEVSDQTGFDNFSHFGKMFKRLTGMAPRDYRSLDREGKHN